MKHWVVGWLPETVIDWSLGFSSLVLLKCDTVTPYNPNCQKLRTFWIPSFYLPVPVRLCLN